MTTPHDLWEQAMAEYPDDHDVRQARWLSLLRDHGMVHRADHPDPAKAVPGVVTVRRRPLADQADCWAEKLLGVAARMGDSDDRAIVLAAAITLNRWAVDELAGR